MVSKLVPVSRRAEEDPQPNPAASDDRPDVTRKKRVPASGRFPALRQEKLTVGRMVEPAVVAIPPPGGFDPVVLDELPLRVLELSSDVALSELNAVLGHAGPAAEPVYPAALVVCAPPPEQLELADIVDSARACSPWTKTFALAGGGRLPVWLRTEAEGLEVELIDMRTSREAVNAMIAARAESVLNVRRRALRLGARLGLTRAVHEVLVGFAHGSSPSYLARLFGLTCGTIESHAKNLYSKASIHSRGELLQLVHDEPLRPGRPSARRRR